MKVADKKRGARTPALRSAPPKVNPPSRRAPARVALPPAPFELPPAYAEVLARFGNQSIRVDARALGKKKPSPWSGRVHVFGPNEVGELDAYFQKKALPRAQRGTLFFFGNDGEGRTFAVDREGAIFTFDHDRQVVERWFATFDVLAKALGLKAITTGVPGRRRVASR